MVLIELVERSYSLISLFLTKMQISKLWFTTPYIIKNCYGINWVGRAILLAHKSFLNKNLKIMKKVLYDNGYPEDCVIQYNKREYLEYIQTNGQNEVI